MPVYCEDKNGLITFPGLGGYGGYGGIIAPSPPFGIDFTRNFYHQLSQPATCIELPHFHNLTNLRASNVLASVCQAHACSAAAERPRASAAPFAPLPSLAVRPTVNLRVRRGATSDRLTSCTFLAEVLSALPLLGHFVHQVFLIHSWGLVFKKRLVPRTPFEDCRLSPRVSVVGAASTCVLAMKGHTFRRACSLGLPPEASPSHHNIDAAQSPRKLSEN